MQEFRFQSPRTGVAAKRGILGSVRVFRDYIGRIGPS